MRAENSQGCSTGVRSMRSGDFAVRTTSLFWLEKALLVLDFLQAYTLLWTMSQAWPWPNPWLRWTRFTLLFGLDLFGAWNVGPFSSDDAGAARHGSPWGERASGAACVGREAAANMGSSAAASTFCGLDYLSYAGAFCALPALAALALVVRHAQGARWDALRGLLWRLWRRAVAPTAGCAAMLQPRWLQRRREVAVLRRGAQAARAKGGGGAFFGRVLGGGGSGGVGGSAGSRYSVGVVGGDGGGGAGGGDDGDGIQLLPGGASNPADDDAPAAMKEVVVAATAKQRERKAVIDAFGDPLKPDPAASGARRRHRHRVVAWAVVAAHALTVPLGIVAFRLLQCGEAPTNQAAAAAAAAEFSSAAADAAAAAAAAAAASGASSPSSAAAAAAAAAAAVVPVAQFLTCDRSVTCWTGQHLAVTCFCAAVFLLCALWVPLLAARRAPQCVTVPNPRPRILLGLCRQPHALLKLCASHDADGMAAAAGLEPLDAAAQHELTLRAAELEYALGINDDWLESGLWLFSSYTLPAVQARSATLALKVAMVAVATSGALRQDPQLWPLQSMLFFILALAWAEFVFTAQPPPPPPPPGGENGQLAAAEHATKVQAQLEAGTHPGYRHADEDASAPWRWAAPSPFRCASTATLARVLATVLAMFAALGVGKGSGARTAFTVAARLYQLLLVAAAFSLALLALAAIDVRVEAARGNACGALAPCAVSRGGGCCGERQKTSKKEEGDGKGGGGADGAGGAAKATAKSKSADSLSFIGGLRMAASRTVARQRSFSAVPEPLLCVARAGDQGWPLPREAAEVLLQHADGREGGGIGETAEARWLEALRQAMQLSVELRAPTMPELQEIGDAEKEQGAEQSRAADGERTDAASHDKAASDGAAARTTAGAAGGGDDSAYDKLVKDAVHAPTIMRASCEQHTDASDAATAAKIQATLQLLDRCANEVHHPQHEVPASARDAETLHRLRPVIGAILLRTGTRAASRSCARPRLATQLTRRPLLCFFPPSRSS